MNMKLYFTILASIVFHGAGYSKDLIVTTNGNKLQVKVEGIEDTQIKYRNYDHLTGPLQTNSSSRIKQRAKFRLVGKSAVQGATRVCFYENPSDQWLFVLGRIDIRQPLLKQAQITEFRDAKWLDTGLRNTFTWLNFTTTTNQALSPAA